jgi:hypothetical protein
VVSIGNAVPAVTGEVQPITPPPFKLQWDAEILVSALRNHKNQKIPNLFGVFDKETNTFLGQYSDAKSVVPNVQLVAQFEAAMQSAGLTWKRDIFTYGVAGAVMSAKYRIHGMDFTGPDGKAIAMQLALRNSYNRTVEVESEASAMRLICLNGMVGWGNVFGLGMRHGPGISVPAIVQKIMPALEQAAGEFVGSFQRLADTALTQDEGEFMLRNMFLRSAVKFSGVTARRIEANWRNPVDDEKDSHLSLWGLYNAATRYFRDLLASDADKAALVARTETHLVNVLQNFGKFRDQLIAPVTSEQAYSRGDE